ncbi:hypothetical protein F0261_15935 [Alteromonas sp. 07-89-2]|uniref:hypothetical protein n=1 Tax=Alteromonas TaxID=226 RepID=UPI00148CEF5D|nr:MULTISPECIES: hypothetical protein [Alteromonas]MCG7812719.1 hypothetical protein [Alteromonas sp. MCA-1]MCZ4239349.1 hypothetical protein [Alteromonas macleodii]NOH59525.1 hypothetical protein [Alteromonas sp. 07-89-2]
MDKDRFSAHGEVHAHYQPAQKILHIDLVGPFNLEFMQEYERVVGAQRKTIDSPCWGSLVNVHGLALAPMQATNAGQEIVSKAVALGLVATAVVLHEPEGVEMQKKFWSRVYESSTLAFEYFDDTTLATQWLSERVLASVQARSVDQLNNARR